MIRPATEIEYPPSQALLARASMISRMEALNKSSQALMSLIAERLGAENLEDMRRVGDLTAEQQRLIDNMLELAQS